MSKERQFRVTTEHLALARRMNVSWDGDEFGAPGIDPKRPYGNSDVLRDMHEILTGYVDPDVELDQLTAARLLELHGEMEMALQVILSTGTFRPGLYVADAYRNNWAWSRV